MAAIPNEKDRVEIVRNLRSLRKGRGLTAEGLSACPTLRRAVGHDDPVLAYQSLSRSLRMSGDSREMRACRNALAIDVVPPRTLTQRRSAFAQVEYVTTKTVEAWENKAFDDVADTLVALIREWTVEHELHDVYVSSGSIVAYRRAVQFIGGDEDEGRHYVLADDAIERFTGGYDTGVGFPFFWYTGVVSDTSPQRIRVNFSGPRPDLVVLHVYANTILASMQAQPEHEMVLRPSRTTVQDAHNEVHEIWTVSTPTLEGVVAGTVLLVGWSGAGEDGNRYGLLAPSGDPSQPLLPIFEIPADSYDV